MLDCWAKWTQPALVSDLSLHHTQFGRWDVGPTGAGQDGVQRFLPLLHWRLLCRRFITFGWGGWPSPPPVLPIPLSAGAPLILIPVTIAVSTSLTLPGPDVRTMENKENVWPERCNILQQDEKGNSKFVKNINTRFPHLRPRP